MNLSTQIDKALHAAIKSCKDYRHGTIKALLLEGLESSEIETEQGFSKALKTMGDRPKRKIIFSRLTPETVSKLKKIRQARQEKTDTSITDVVHAAIQIALAKRNQK